MLTFDILRQVYEMNSHLEWEREQVVDYQDRMFRKMLRYAYDNRRFYREFYNDHGIKRKDLNEISHHELPGVNKEIVLENFDKIAPEQITVSEIEQFLAQNRDPGSRLRNKYNVIHTSGTTGRIGYFLYGIKEWSVIKALGLRLFPSFNLKPQRYAFVGAVDGHYAGVTLFSSPQYGGFLEKFLYKSNLVDVNLPVQRWVELLNNFKPHVLCGYSAAVNMLGEEQRKTELKISPHTIICSGEPLNSVFEANIKSSFGVSPTDYYSASESLSLGVRSPDSQCIYLFDDVNCFEAAGKNMGYFLTNLYNYSFPLIRYKMTDQLIFDDSNNQGRWQFAAAKRLSGRSEDILWLKNSSGDWEFIHPITFVEFFSPGVTDLRIVRLTPFKIRLEAVFSRKEDPRLISAAEERLREILKRKELTNIEISVKEVDEIGSDPNTGKTQMIVQ